MKGLSISILTLIFAQISFGQKSISIDSVKNYLGEKVSVCSKVYGIKSTDKVTFINLGAAYPNSPLTIVIFAKDLVNFKETPSSLYTDKNICVTGTLKDYNGKPEIIISKPDEIAIKQ
jgi:hypothetical protein